MNRLLPILLTLAACSPTPDGAQSFDSDIGNGTPRPYPGDDLGVGVYKPEEAVDLPPVHEDCPALDVLFVVDDSGSMDDDRDRVAAFLPDLALRVGSLVNDLHIGVTTTGEAGCDVRGGLQIEPVGPWHGERYMTDTIDLATVAGHRVPNTAGTELALNAVIAALDPETECTEGWHREGTGLLVVIITDEDEQTLGGLENLWRLIELLHGNERIAVLAILNPDAQNRFENLQEVAPHVVLTSLYESDYSDAFDAATRELAGACGLVPPEG